jgi:cation-transporting P-type ATPase E
MVEKILSDSPSETLLPGLNAAEVQQRRERGETNQYEARVNRSYWDIFRDNVLNLFNIVLFSLLGVVLFMKDYGTIVFAGFSVVSNTFLGMIQEMSAKRRLDRLAAMTVQKAMVWRDGKRQEIPMREVVKDDVLELEPGTKAVVDGIVLQSDALEMDESLLTGESDAVFKDIGTEIFSGSFCTAGKGMMKATRVGAESNINRLSEVAKVYKKLRTPTQKRIDIIVEFSVIAMFIFVPMLFINNLLVTTPPLPPLQAVRNAVVFVTTLVPQGLVLTAILSLTIGAIKISMQETLVQKVNAVESLANASVLCFDKTGTLTKNELAVAEIIFLGDNDEQAVKQALANYLANLAYRNRTASTVQTYIEQSVKSDGRRKTREIPFTSGRKWGGIVYGEETWLLGAAERLLPPHHVALIKAHNLSEAGMRVLAFSKMNGIPESDRLNGEVEGLALVVMSDQIRDDIQQTLADLRAEGLKLKVLSGDNIETVQSIAKEAGMVITGAYEGKELDAMSDEVLEKIAQEANVFARVEPNTKRRIIAALQRQREYVAMVGDGVNDVPALKQADLAIVMNDGTQISKDVADIVLLNNAMSTLPRAFREGREITQSIFGTTKLFMIRAVYHVALFVFVLFMSLPFPITPVQISWVTFGSVNMPATLLALAIIRPKFIKNFRDDVLDYIVTGGFVGSILLVILYVTAYFSAGRDANVARSAVTFFVTLFNVYMVLTIQGVDLFDFASWRSYWRAILIMVALMAFTFWSMYALPQTFDFNPISFATHPMIFVLLVLLFLLAIVLMSTLMRYRHILNRLWALMEKDDKTFSATIGD